MDKLEEIHSHQGSKCSLAPISQEMKGQNQMTGEVRRSGIIEKIKKSGGPVAGGELARLYGVSRQVIVQDIALLRAAGYGILSTNRGYYMNEKPKASRIFKVSHTDEEIKEELYTIVDLGGVVADVFINHRVYGRIQAELGIHSRKKAAEFLDDINSGKSSPLKNITSNYHYHTILADTEADLDIIGEELQKKGFLI